MWRLKINGKVAAAKIPLVIQTDEIQEAVAVEIADLDKPRAVTAVVGTQ